MADTDVRPLRHHLMRLTLLGLAPLAVFAALAIYLAAHAHRTELARSTLDLSRAVASAVQAELDGTLMSLANITRSPELQTRDVPAFYRRAQRLMELQSDWSGIALADNRGKMLFRTDAPLSAAPLPVHEPESMAQVLRTGEPAVSKVMRNQQGQPAVAVRFPAYVDGELAYVVTAMVPAARMVSMLERLRAPEGWVIAVVDHQLRIFARSRAHAQYVMKESTPELRTLVTSGHLEGTGLARTHDGAQVVTGFSRTQDARWLVAVGAPSTPLANLFTPTLALYVAGATGSLLICAVLALRAVRRISADIGKVAQAAQRLGELDDGEPAPMPPSRIEEIDRLGRALQEAAERLHSAQLAQDGALQQAQEASRAKDAFLAMLGHELRNPLAPMVSAMYLLDARSNESSARERSILRRQMDHLRRLVDDLLDVARITRGRVDIQPQPLELVAELATVLDDVREAHPEAAPMLRLHRATEAAWVMGDARRLAQVFTNLLTNAIRHGQGQAVDVTIKRSGDMIEVLVQDHGEGMNAQTLARVFEAFYQSPKEPHQPRGGLGLGLAIVQSIVRAHGGSVVAHSDGPGLGSRFEVVLPARSAPTA